MFFSHAAAQKNAVDMDELTGTSRPGEMNQ